MPMMDRNEKHLGSLLMLFIPGSVRLGLILLILMFAGCNADPLAGFHLQLTASTPAALDSWVKFTANLVHANGTVLDRDKYKYTWRDDLTLKDEHTKGDNYSECYKTYHSAKSDGARNIMSVNVTEVKGNKKTPVANGTVPFVLTENLNVVVRADQPKYPSQPKNVFSTAEDVNFLATLDNFTDASYLYTWNITGPDTKIVFKNIPSPSVDAELKNVGSYVVMTTSTVTYKLEANATNTRSGKKSYSFEMKDPVSSVELDVSDSVHYPRKPFTISLNCTGSAPFKIRWNISTSDGNLTDSGVQGILQKPCELVMEKNLTKDGLYVINTVVSNDVGEMTTSANLTIHPTPPLPAAGSVGIPIVCAFIGLTVIALVLGTYFKERREPKPSETTETADFNFRTYSRHGGSNGRFSYIFYKVKDYFHRLTSRTSTRDNTITDNSLQNHASYGALDSGSHEMV